MNRIVCLCVIVIGIWCSFATAQLVWVQDSMDSITGTPLGITWGSSMFVLVTSMGGICNSTNGILWTKQTSGITKRLSSIIYGNNQYVAIGDTGTILTSPDGITWTQRTSGTRRCFRNVAYGNSQYVAVGDSGTILTSSNGITWTLQTSGTIFNIYGVTYGNNQFVAVSGTGTILTSPNGSTWTLRTTGSIYGLLNIAFGNNTYVAVGPGQSGATSTVVYTSPDGITWTDRTAGGITGYQNCYAITYGAGYFVAADHYGIFTSTSSGVYWNQVKSVTETLYCAAFGNNTFVVAGNALYTSPAVNAIRYTAPKAGINQLLTITNNTARFTLTQAANTNLTLFDLNGRAVASLVSGNKAAGTYNATLPTKLPQGRYLLSLKAGEASCVTPVMITR